MIIWVIPFKSDKLKDKLEALGIHLHTCAYIHLTSVAIRIRVRYPDRHQNLRISSMAHRQPSPKISCKSVHKLLRKVAKRQTDKQRRLHILLGRGKQELIRRWDSERELFYDDIVHIQASAYAHWTDFLISTKHLRYLPTHQSEF